MRILGIDPGSQVTGYGIIDAGDSTPQAVHYGTLRPRRGDALPDRLLFLYNGLHALLTEHEPDLVVLETAFYHKNARSTLVLGQVRGALMVCARASTCEVAELTPREVKMGVTGAGGASKEQVQFMVRRMLNLRDELPHDASDALAVALCAWQRRGRVPAGAVPKGIGKPHR